MRVGKTAIWGSFILILVLAEGNQVSWSASEQASSPQERTERKEASGNFFQRSLEIYEFKRASKSGPERGQEIFYYKCWFCHNEYTKVGLNLQGLYKRPKLLSGQAVNDETVAEKIRNGGPGMPAYRYSLRDADLADLVSYLREKCCWDSDNPPANPRFRAR